MKDYQAHLEKLRKDAAESALVRDLATERAKRDMFRPTVLDELGDEVERAPNKMCGLKLNSPKEPRSLQQDRNRLGRSPREPGGGVR
jgi:hypothetical protein